MRNYFFGASFMVEKFVRRFSKALGTAQALCQVVCMNTAPAAVPEDRTGHYRVSVRSPLLGEKLPCAATGTPIIHRRKNVCANKYVFRGLRKMRMQGRFCICVRKGWYLSKHLKVNCRIKE